MNLLVGLLLWGSLNFAYGEVRWVTIPAGSYKPLFSPSEADPKGLINLQQNEKKEKPPLTVAVESFELQQEPVTNEDFLAFTLKNSQWRRDKVKTIFADKNYLRHWKSSTQIAEKKNLKAPVVNVSWFAAQAYCESIGGQLPTIDQWEFVASQDDSNKRDAIILNWYAQTATENGASSFTGRYGVRDMYGKIWEWTYDFNSSLVTGESREDNSLSRSMFCGSGSIGASNPTEYATFMRFAFRTSLKGNYSLPTLGFRCVREKRQK